MQPSGEVTRVEVVNRLSPPADRKRYLRRTSQDSSIQGEYQLTAVIPINWCTTMGMKHRANRHIGACRELVRIVEFYRLKRKSYRHRRLEWALEDFYERYGPGMLAAFAETLDVKLLFPASAMHSLNPGMVARKASLYSGCTLCVLPGQYSVARRKFVDIDGFCEFVIRSRAAIRKGKLIPFPSVDMSPCYWDYPPEWLAGIYRPMERKLGEDGIEGYAKKCDSIPVFGKHQDLIQQINEESHDNSFAAAGMQNLFFPTLHGLDLDTMLKVMEDHGDPTARFRLALRGIMKQGAGDLGDKALYHTMQRIDVEIRNLSSEMQRISMDRTLRRLETGIGALAVGLSFCAPAWMAPIAAEVLGSLTAVDGARHLIAAKRRESEIRQNDFYVPWLLHQHAA